MPPKPAAKGVSKPAAKAPAKTPAKTGASKTGATGTKTGAKTVAASKGAAKETDVKQVEEEMAQVSIKKILVPRQVELKGISVVLSLGEDVEKADGLKKEIIDSNRWVYLTDYAGTAHTFFKYRDVNMISLKYEFNKEPLRKALMGALKFGKPHIIDVREMDQGEAMGKVRDKYNEIYDGLWDDIMDRSILEFTKCGKLYQANDDLEYKNPYDYRVSTFQFIVYTNEDPPSTAMDSFFPMVIKEATPKE